MSSTFCVRVLPPVRSQPAAALFHSSIFVEWQPVSSHSLVTIFLHHFDFRVLCYNCLVTDFSTWRMLTYLTSPRMETIAYPWSSLLTSSLAFLDWFLRADGQNWVQCRRQSTTQIYTVAWHFQVCLFSPIISKYFAFWTWIDIQK